MVFVDTSFLVALAIPSDALHRSARAWISAIHDACVSSEYVLFEFVNRMSAPMLRARAHEMLAEIRKPGGILIVPASEALLARARSLHASRADKSWPLTDCSSFEIMRSRGVTKALTYDLDFQQAGFVALLRNTPP